MYERGKNIITDLIPSLFYADNVVAAKKKTPPGLTAKGAKQPKTTTKANLPSKSV